MLVDLMTVAACVAAVALSGKTRHSHPAVLYLLFHILVVTGRAVAIQAGAPTFLSGSPSLQPPDSTEIARAVIYADIALVAATGGWLSTRTRGKSPSGATAGAEDSARMIWRILEHKKLVAVALVAVPIGLATTAAYGFVPGSEPARLATSSYQTLAITWPGLMLIGLIYRSGFRLHLVVPLIAYLVLLSFQGYGRFRVIIPVLLLVHIYLDRRNRRWPGLRLIAGLLAVLLLFFPLKAIGRGVQSGSDASSLATAVRSSVAEVFSGQAADQAILDQLALTLSLSDDSGRIYAGRPYLNVITLPIPREWWPGKPGLADHLTELSQSSRPLGEIGAVTTLPGDLYLNFRLPGLALGMYLFARLTGRLHDLAYRRPYESVGRFAYLLLAASFIQVYRDGLISVPLFVFVQMLPLMVVIALHARKTLPARQRSTSRYHVSDSGVGASRR